MLYDFYRLIIFITIRTGKQHFPLFLCYSKTKEDKDIEKLMI